MAGHGSVFGAMLQEFEGAAKSLNLDKGLWRMLTHPKRQIIVSCPVQMDNGEIEVFTGTKSESISALKDEITKRTGGKLDVLFNNAGMSRSALPIVNENAC